MASAAPASKRKQYKIFLLGSGGVGKSALTIRLVNDNFLGDYDPTIEDSYLKPVLIDEEQATLDIRDTAGQEEFNSMQDQWIRDGKGFMLVYNITSRPTFDEVSELYEKILRTKDEEKVPIERQVASSEGDALASKWGGVPFYETSARLKINNEACFHELVREMRKVEQAEEKVKEEKQIRKEKKKKMCVIL